MASIGGQSGIEKRSGTGRSSYRQVRRSGAALCHLPQAERTRGVPSSEHVHAKRYTVRSSYRPSHGAVCFSLQKTFSMILSRGRNEAASEGPSLA